MHKYFFLVFIFYTACTLPEEKKTKQLSEKSDTTVMEANDANTATSLDTSNSIPLPVVKKIKSPGGIYQTVLSNKRIEQTIAFNSDLTYQLQEKYFSGEKDSLVLTEGTWMPSDGFIWLYKDQVVSGRYKWKGDTLQYFSPVLKKSFSMRHLQDAMQNSAWKIKGKEGIILFGAGNEPFWNVELNNKDSISFLLSDWSHPLKLKLGSAFNNKDSIGYAAKNDSTQIRVTIFPRFCTDGMTDYVYRNKVRVQYNHQVFSGCGILYK
jgi:uncharacterized membrane protein